MAIQSVVVRIRNSSFRPSWTPYPKLKRCCADAIGRDYTYDGAWFGLRRREPAPSFDRRLFGLTVGWSEGWS